MCDLETGEVVEVKFIDHRAGTGEWGKCLKCGSDVFCPQSLLIAPESRIECKCGAVAVECVRFAVRYRRLPNAGTVPRSGSDVGTSPLLGKDGG